MAWIELHQSLWTHKKTILLAACLDIDEIYAAAHMAKLWTWSLDNAQNGDLSDLPNRVIAFGAGWKGDADVFVRSLIGSGLIDEENGNCKIHDWYDYAGRLIEKKEANKERAQKSRERKTERARTVRATNEYGAENEGEQNAHVAGLPNQTKPYLNKDILSSANKDEGKEKSEESQKPESFYLAHKRVFGFECNPLQSQKLSAYIDNDGIDESVVIRAIERAAEKGTSYRFGLITKILNDYADAGAKTVEAAVALDNEFSRRLSDEKYERSASSFKHRGNQTTGPDYEGPNSFEQQYPGVIVKL